MTTEFNCVEEVDEKFGCDIQAAMDYSVKKLVEQGEQCRLEDCCAYGSGAKHCSVGWLLPNISLYMDFEGPIHSLKTWGATLPKIIESNLDLFTLLQDFHDSTTRSRREKLRILLSEQGIDTSGKHWKAWVRWGGNQLL